MREAVVAVMVAAAALGAVPAAASADPVVVAVLDSGIDAAHPEFAAGQVVAWWDFTTELGKTEAQTDWQASATPTWDPYVSPYDWHGHGTATASLVGGANTAAGAAACGKTSHAPGVRLAVAKVATVDEDVVRLASAIRWAVDAAGADVVSLSIGSFLPQPGLLSEADEAIAEARAKGVLVVVSAGNGLFDAGLAPYPSEAGSHGFSRSALVVGSAGEAGPSLTVGASGNLDPEVVAWGRQTCVALANVGSYGRMSGTSFAAPLVAGAAASAIADARAAGQDATPARIEAVLKAAARDSLLPYAFEGWGFLGATEVAAARAAAAAGTLPAHPCATVCLEAEYEALVAEPARFVAEGVLDTDATTP